MLSDCVATEAIAIRYTGSGSACSVSVDNTTGKLTTSVTGASDNLDITLSANENLNALSAVINATGKYTATNAICGTHAKPIHLKTQTIADIKGAIGQLTMDEAQYLTYETTGAKADLETKLKAYYPSYSCTSFAYPGGHSDATVRNYVHAAGFTGARGISSYSETTLLSSMSRYNTASVPTGNLVGLISETPTEAQVKERVLAWVEYLRWNGGFGNIYQHGFIAETTFDTDVSIETFGYILKALSESGATVLSYSDAMTRIASEAESTTGSTGSLAYVRSESHLGDASDYRLRAGSPAINAGVDVGLTTDFLGKPIRGVPDIGAYEFQSVGGGLGMGIIYGF
jgi:hypothetical protein